MPVHHYGFQSRHERDDLVQRIVCELEANREGREVKGDPPDTGPQVYIDDAKGGPEDLHVCVIDPFWEDVPDIQRPAIIMDAFKKAGWESHRIAVAMGLTPDEAEALGIETS